MNFLAIECATNKPGAALFIDNECVDERKVYNGNSSALAQLINNMIDNSNIDCSDFDFIAVTVGPGTFTGLRVGISLAQGISFSIKKPIVPVNVFDVIKYKKNNDYHIAFHSHKEFVYYSKSTEVDSIKLIKINDLKGKQITG